jgi:hypothetical protein
VQLRARDLGRRELRRLSWLLPLRHHDPNLADDAETVIVGSSSGLRPEREAALQ